MTWNQAIPRGSIFPRGNVVSFEHERLEIFTGRVNPLFKINGPVRSMLETVEAALHGEILNLMVMLPPGTGKSEIYSRLTPAHVTFSRPKWTVGVSSYGAMLAHEMTRDAREYFVEAGGLLDPAQRAKTRWKTTQGGGMWGAGFGGSIRGLRYHVGIVDDPHKDRDSIDSHLKRERLFRWWDNTWMNRGHLFSEDPVVRIVVMQRLADNDLCGWLLGRPDADKWTVIAADAIRDTETPFAIPEGVRVLPDKREHGELLLPDHLTQEKLDELRIGDEDTFLAQYQQRPPARTGTIIDPKWFPIMYPHQVPPMIRKVIGGDLAVSTKQSADLTAGAPVGLGIDQRFYIFRPLWERIEAPQSRERFAILAKLHRVVGIGIESVAFQLAFVQEMMGMVELSGIPIIDVDADRDKEARARAWAWIAFQGRIVLVEDGSGWTTRALDQFQAFPSQAAGIKDDLIDAIGVAMRMHATFSPAETAGGGPSRPSLKGIATS